MLVRLLCASITLTGLPYATFYTETTEITEMKQKITGNGTTHPLIMAKDSSLEKKDPPSRTVTVSLPEQESRQKTLTVHALTTQNL